MLQSGQKPYHFYTQHDLIARSRKFYTVEAAL
jgi:hypothetical protein